MAFDPVTAVLDLVNGVGGKLIDRLFPDPTEKAKAQLALAQMQQSGELEMYKVQLSAIIAEANSTDKWTSRARPSFLYIIYIMILCGLPMGVLAAFRPEIAMQIGAGLGHWLDAIPDSMWALFGAGYLGYTGARTWEKNKGVAK